MVVSHPAHAQQVSDADRKAARDLYNQAVGLQQQSKFAEALDAFQRSFSVFPAPTTALHVAQCQASLGHLVEAEEDYRALANAKVPDGSPQAFYQAQDQARTEVASISPRVPTIRVITTPAQVPGVTITVDGQPMNSALVGAPRPVNPGTHKVVGNAPGYATAETSVTVQEKESKDVPLAMHSTGVAPVQTGTGTAQNNQQQQQQRPLYEGQGQRPLYEGQGQYRDHPYVEMKRRSPGLWGGGLAMVIVGPIVTVIGFGVVIAGAADQTCFGSTLSCTSDINNGKSLVTDGTIAIVIGVALIGGGIAMMVVGGRKVPATAAMLLPKPTANGLAWTF
jgi:hypothetical protein